MKKLTAYSLASIGCLVAVVGQAFYNNGQFYTSMVALSQSRLFNVLVSNSFMVVVVLLFELLRYIFLGKLRDQEVEKVMHNTAFFLMETSIMLTVFNIKTLGVDGVALFVLCIFWKIFHWLARSRLDFIEQTPALGSSQARLALLLFMLILGDSFAGKLFARQMIENGPSVKLILLEEYLIMTVLATTSLLRLLVHIIDAKRNRRWESTGAARFYLEIVSDVLQCVIYIVFFYLIYFYYGFPLNLVREMYVTIRNLYRAIKNFVNYRRLAASLDTKFPDATEEEIAGDPTCSICFDEMLPGEAKRLECRHLFHRHCLRQWLERQTTCPYCRQTIDTSLGANRAAAAAREQADAGNNNNNNNVNENNGNINIGQEPQNQAPQQQQQQQQQQQAFSEGELEAAFRLYESLFVSSDVQAPLPAAPTPHMSAAMLKMHTPSIEEVEYYKEFHTEMLMVYSKLHEKLKAVEDAKKKGPEEKKDDRDEQRQ